MLGREVRNRVVKRTKLRDPIGWVTYDRSAALRRFTKFRMMRRKCGSRIKAHCLVRQIPLKPTFVFFRPTLALPCHVKGEYLNATVRRITLFRIFSYGPMSDTGTEKRRSMASTRSQGHNGGRSFQRIGEATGKGLHRNSKAVIRNFRAAKIPRVKV
jgi:hypothetical protein